MANFFFNETLRFNNNLLNFICTILEWKWSWLMAYVHTVRALITPNADLLQSAESIPVTAGTNDLQFQMIKLISVLNRFEEAWLSQHTQIVSVDICEGQWTMPMSWLFLAQGWWWQSSENALTKYKNVLLQNHWANCDQIRTKNCWVRGIQFCSNEGPGPFPGGDNYMYENQKYIDKIWKSTSDLQNHQGNFNQTWH